MADRIVDINTLKRFPAREGAVDDNGRLLVKPAAFWNQFSEEERFVFCVRHGVYLLPTTELVAWLRNEITIGGPDQLERCIEIGSGNGVLADALGIKGTDSMLQKRPEIAEHYARLGQALTTYGPRVLEFDAVSAVKRFNPSTVIGAWVTHLWRDELDSGSPHGIEESEIIAKSRYIFVGNNGGSTQHGKRPLLKRRHARYSFPWLVSRGERGRDFIAIWERRK